MSKMDVNRSRWPGVCHSPFSPLPAAADDRCEGQTAALRPENADCILAGTSSQQTHRLSACLAQPAFPRDLFLGGRSHLRYRGGAPAGSPVVRAEEHSFRISLVV